MRSVCIVRLNDEEGFDNEDYLGNELLITQMTH